MCQDRYTVPKAAPRKRGGRFSGVSRGLSGSAALFEAYREHMAGSYGLAR